MRNSLIVGLCCAVAILGGAGYYFYQPAVPPPPKDAAANLPTRFREKVTPEQLAMLRGERSSAPLVSAGPVGNATAGSPEKVPVSENGLVVDLSGTMGELKGKLSNETASEITYECLAGTLFSNAGGQVIALRDVSLTVPGKTSSDISIPVAPTASANSAITGRFQRDAGNLAALAPVLKVIASDSSLSPGAMQTAVLLVTENVPLDAIAKFPSLLPNSAASFDPKQPWRVSTSDILAALTVLKDSGMDLEQIALMQNPQLKIMSLLDPESHDTAKKFYGISNPAEWSFWKDQLLTGDPALRHVALYGIGRYYPEVALSMLPRWVEAEKLPHTYRVAAAGALGLVDDARANELLLELKQKVTDNMSVQQAILRAINR